MGVLVNAGSQLKVKKLSVHNLADKQTCKLHYVATAAAAEATREKREIVAY